MTGVTALILIVVIFLTWETAMMIFSTRITRLRKFIAPLHVVRYFHLQSSNSYWFGGAPGGGVYPYLEVV